MMPWTHLAIGYLVYSVGKRLGSGQPPAGGPTLVLAFATQFPDLVDKPLNWGFDVFDGRGLGHSLLLMVPVCIAVYVLARRYERTGLAIAFGTGVLTHILGDAWRALVAGTVRADAPFLLWPLLPSPTYAKEGLVDHISAMIVAFRSLPWHSPEAMVTSWFALQVILVSVPFLLWGYDGFPGLKTGLRLLGGARPVGRERP